MSKFPDFVSKFRQHGGPVLWGVFLVAILAYPVYHTVETGMTDLPPQNATDNQLIAYWRGEIKTLGAGPAYQMFSCSVGGEPDLTAHPLAHVFGAALYLEKGIQGINICDDRFEYGCLHEFLGRAIADHGLGVASELDTVCKSAFTGDEIFKCEHGIGHGILAYTGYDRSTLDGALQICNTLPGSGSAGACESGLFMEYFNQTMLADQASIPKKSAEELFSECASVPAADRAGCVFELPRQWRKNLFADTATTTQARKQIGTWCESYSTDASLYRACAQGIGNDLYLLTNGDEALASKLCGVSAQSAQALAYCTSQVSDLLNSYQSSEAYTLSCPHTAPVSAP